MKRCEYLRQQRLRTKKSEARRLSRPSRMIRWRSGYCLPEYDDNQDQGVVSHAPGWVQMAISKFVTSVAKAKAQVRQIQRVDDEKVKAEIKRLNAA